MSSDIFEPNRAISRAEFVALLVRALGLQQAAAGHRGQFVDVSPDAWSAAAIEAAVEAGLASGLSDTSFAPDAAITREQMAALIERAVRFLGGDSLPVVQIPDILVAYKDRAVISPWAEEAVANMLASGIMAGMNEQGEIGPRDTATRAQAVAMLRRLLTQMNLMP